MENQRVHLDQMKRFYCEEERRAEARKNEADEVIQDEDDGRYEIQGIPAGEMVEAKQDTGEDQTGIWQRNNGRYKLRTLRKDEHGRTKVISQNHK